MTHLLMSLDIYSVLFELLLMLWVLFWGLFLLNMLGHLRLHWRFLI